jgi:hypothetical protein
MVNINSNLPGYLSLNAWVPYAGMLSWEELVEFRKHPALVEFRSKLISVEQKVREIFAEASEDDISYAIFQILTDELLAEINNLRPSKSGVAKDVGIDVALSLIGAIIPPLDLVTEIVGLFTNIPEAKNLVDQRASWITALMDLRYKNL